MSFVISPFSSASGTSNSTNTPACVGEIDTGFIVILFFYLLRSLRQTVLLTEFLTGSCSDITLLGAAKPSVSWKLWYSWYCIFCTGLGLELPAGLQRGSVLLLARAALGTSEMDRWEMLFLTLSLSSLIPCVQRGFSPEAQYCHFFQKLLTILNVLCVLKGSETIWTSPAGSGTVGNRGSGQGCVQLLY